MPAGQRELIYHALVAHGLESWRPEGVAIPTSLLITPANTRTLLASRSKIATRRHEARAVRTLPAGRAHAGLACTRARLAGAALPLRCTHDLEGPKRSAHASTRALALAAARARPQKRKKPKPGSPVPSATRSTPASQLLAPHNALTPSLALPTRALAKLHSTHSPFRPHAAPRWRRFARLILRRRRRRRRLGVAAYSVL